MGGKARWRYREGLILEIITESLAGVCASLFYTGRTSETGIQVQLVRSERAGQIRIGCAIQRDCRFVERCRQVPQTGIDCNDALRLENMPREPGQLSETTSSDHQNKRCWYGKHVGSCQEA